MDWSKGRYERHQATFPPEEKAERNRVAQETYRRRNHERIEAANTARAILVRQNWYPGDAGILASRIVRSIGKECAKELIEALIANTAPVAGGKTRTTAAVPKPAKKPKRLSGLATVRNSIRG